MSFDLKELKASLEQHGYLRNHSYDIVMTVPPIMTNSRLRIVNTLSSAEIDASLLDIPKIIQVRAEETGIPGSMLLTADNSRHGIGPITKNPYNAVFTDTTITFLADRFGLLWSFFYLWKQSIFTWDQKASGSGALVPSYRTQYRRDESGRGTFITDITINVYDMTGTPRMSFKLIDAYPTLVPSTPVAWGATDSLMKLRVGFTFQRYEMQDITSVANGQARLPTTTDGWTNALTPNISASQPSSDFTTGPAPTP